MCFPISPITSREKVCWCDVFESLGFKWLAKVVTWKEKKNIFHFMFIFHVHKRDKGLFESKACQDYFENSARTEADGEHSARIWIWMAKDQAWLLMVISVHTWLVEADTTISGNLLWAEMEMISFIYILLFTWISTWMEPEALYE